MTPMPTTTPAERDAHGARASVPAERQLRDTVHADDHRREQPGHDGLRDVDVKLLVQVRGREAERPSRRPSKLAAPAAAAAMNGARPIPAGTWSARNRGTVRGVTGRGSGMRTSNPAKTDASTMSTT